MTFSAESFQTCEVFEVIKSLLYEKSNFRRYTEIILKHVSKDSINSVLFETN